MTISPERLKQLQNLPDSEIDTSDIPELDEQFWKNARKVEPVSQETVTIPLDQDVLNWLKHQTPHYQTLINQVLRAYMNQH
ncbi:BrnA antitoxin family protein [Spirulina sp. CS-785/01]|uniref:BrnA antitoxin family protein n=1 Tax=Spirulina sp. CS-785/01 TaxID=3021716 RepID=UPI00233152E5|nr:BrnA antitoxin family protein [Spirulina sp. CS-785/01]MDB9313825.1 BrnA antitoxin family protein [Spirulina sp. CS-785/01]